MERYCDKNVLITGASMGLGAEFARQLAGRRANLILTARSEDALQRLSDELSERYAVQIHVIPMDLSKPDAAAKLFEAVQKTGIHVDVLINNAGFGKWGYFDEYDPATYEEMITLNIQSLVTLTRLFIPQMLEKEEGGILNVASNAGYQPVPYFSVYSASKAFVLHFSEALWAEYKDHGIRVLALSPGATETNFHIIANADRDKFKKMMSADSVVTAGLEALLEGKPSLITGFKNVIQYQIVRLFPRKSFLKLTSKMFHPKYG